jgi:hypothetical protein
VDKSRWAYPTASDISKLSDKLFQIFKLHEVIVSGMRALPKGLEKVSVLFLK